jgi:SAM-dependent methyltransferase
MLAEIHTQLREAADHLQSRGIDSLPEACATIPLEVFGAVQIDRPDAAQPLLQFLPTMPADDVQLLWTGASGHALLAHSLAFVRTLAGHIPAWTNRSAADANLLDFGCGWGRLLRLACKLVRPSHIWGVDPWDRSIELCREHNVLGDLRISSWIPRELDVPFDLDVAYAFSVFTHLPEELAVIALRTLTRHLATGGRLLLSIRPVEYWAWHDFSASGARGYSRERAENEHRTSGYTFVPHDRPPIEGILAYGDSSMTVDYAVRLAAPLRLVALEWSAVDTLQLVLVFEKP